MKLHQAAKLHCIAPVIGGTTLQYAHIQPIPSAKPPSLNRGMEPTDDPMEKSDKYFDKLKRDAQFPTKKKKTKKKLKTMREKLLEFEEGKNPLKYRLGLARRNANPVSLPAESTALPHHTAHYQFGMFGSGEKENINGYVRKMFAGGSGSNGKRIRKSGYRRGNRRASS